jgi:hypothetical protein
MKDANARKMIDEIAEYLGLETKWAEAMSPLHDGPCLPPHIELTPNNLRSTVRILKSDRDQAEHEKTGIHYCKTCGSIKGKKHNDS